MFLNVKDADCVSPHVPINALQSARVLTKWGTNTPDLKNRSVLRAVSVIILVLNRGQ